MIFLDVLGEVEDLASDDGDDVAGPVIFSRVRCDNPDLGNKSIFTGNKPSSSSLIIAITRSALDVDCLGLRVRYGGDIVSALALEWSKAHLELHFELLDLLLARLGDLCSQVLVAVVIVCSARVPIFLKLNEGKEAGLLC